MIPCRSRMKRRESGLSRRSCRLLSLLSPSSAIYREATALRITSTMQYKQHFQLVKPLWRTITLLVIRIDLHSSLTLRSPLQPRIRQRHISNRANFLPRHLAILGLVHLVDILLSTWLGFLYRDKHATRTVELVQQGLWDTFAAAPT